ncbi:hypothetical protein [Desulfotomaculum sp. 1211_IL3151]|uniref:hypothetical protein n=1 Tax=Desulfotomaculum sp. 1211_IL3151 TaxID=3084055 RepID=UPI002FD9E044
MKYQVNLLPPYLEPQQPTNYGKKLFLTTLAGLLLLLLFIAYGIFYTKLTLLQRQVDRETVALSELQEKTKSLQNLIASNKMKEEQFLALSQLAQNPLCWYELLREIPLALPMDTWLTGIEIKKVENISSEGGFVSAILGNQGKTTAQEIPPKESKKTVINTPPSPPVPNILYIYGACWVMGSVGVLVDNLSQLPHFQNVKLVEAKYDRQRGMIKFELVAQIKTAQS